MLIFNTGQPHALLNTPTRAADHTHRHRTITPVGRSVYLDYKGVGRSIISVFRFSYARKRLSSYKMRYFAKLTFVSGTPKGQWKSSIAVRAERVCTHTSARTPSLNTHEIMTRMSLCFVSVR